MNVCNENHKETSDKPSDVYGNLSRLLDVRLYNKYIAFLYTNNKQKNTVKNRHHLQ